MGCLDSFSNSVEQVRISSRAGSKCQCLHYLSLLALMHQELYWCIQPPTHPPLCIYIPIFPLPFVCLITPSWGLKPAARGLIKSFRVSNDSKTLKHSCKGSGPNIIREKRNRKCSYLFQDAGEPLGLTVNDNLPLLPLVQILEHFQERGLSHGLHVHGGHQPIPLCCRVQNLLQH